MSGNVLVAVPEDVTKLLDPEGTEVDARVREALVLYLYQRQEISSRTGAELLGISWDAFRKLLSERDIPYFQQTAEEVLHDAEVSAQVRAQRSQ